MQVHFIGEIIQRYPRTGNEEFNYNVVKAIVDQRIPSLLFMEEEVEADELQREFLLHFSKLTRKFRNINELHLPIRQEFFVYDYNGDISNLQYSQLEIGDDGKTGLGIRIHPWEFFEDIQYALKTKQPSNEPNVNIFWDIWEYLKNY